MQIISRIFHFLFYKKKTCFSTNFFVILQRDVNKGEMESCSGSELCQRWNEEVMERKDGAFGFNPLCERKKVWDGFVTRFKWCCLQYVQSTANVRKKAWRVAVILWSVSTFHVKSFVKMELLSLKLLTCTMFLKYICQMIYVSEWKLFLIFQFHLIQVLKILILM